MGFFFFFFVGCNFCEGVFFDLLVVFVVVLFEFNFVVFLFSMFEDVLIVEGGGVWVRVGFVKFNLRFIINKVLLIKILVRCCNVFFL